jgi:DNA relaxase NicK
MSKKRSLEGRGGTRNHFYVEMSGTTCRIEKIVVVRGQYVFYVFYAE